MEEFISRIYEHQLILTEEEFKNLENCFNDFYFEYAFIQFQRGLELGLAFRHTH